MSQKKEQMQAKLVNNTLEACEYICGDCGVINKLKPNDAVRCQHCAFRILYKKRTKKVLQYEGR